MTPSLVYYPDPTLRQVTEPVRGFSGDSDLAKEIKVLTDHMRQIMKDNAGMGLAAPQVGDNRRIIVVEYTPPAHIDDTPIPFTVLINPEIVAQGKKTDVLNEGCLSIPYVEVDIERPIEVTVKAVGLNGEPVTIRAKGLLARIIQHEIDHLNGKLILDYEPKSAPSQDNAKPRVIMWGSTEFTTHILNTIRHDVQITHIVTEPPKPSGRKQELTPTVAKQYADTLGIPTIEPHDLSDPRLYTYLLSLKPDLMLVAAYGRLIPENLYGLPNYGTLNIHPSLLPKYRGATPIQSAILAGDKETGVTLMKLASTFDTGDIIIQAPYKLEGTETYKDLEFELALLGAELFKAALPSYMQGRLEPYMQEDAEASGTKKMTKADAWLNMDESAEINERKVRAYNPNPGTFVILDGQPLKVLEAHIENDELVFDTVQPAGKKAMSWSDFLRGYRKEIHFDDYRA